MKYFPLTRAPILAFSSAQLAGRYTTRAEELKSLFTGISARITISLRRKACMCITAASRALNESRKSLWRRSNQEKRKRIPARSGTKSQYMNAK
jgi:hypothetical protein